ncbi:flagellar filament capping protein FliD [Thalassotalea sp. LPB0316]|uniref:flagellar filament capping protein FliD n=1 Tax=Thalassotalea sp. LPB0316 TaxID=2769490 RepID=UPI001865D05C|nr:flagellar filament capping protein FliD [Thalassotalea sp. LPB0316]QOL27076.1 flagellar filament capping protein FliD [Thalassotalea sp. LPB0316]
MALITSAGVGSGLDLESIISATVDAARLPKLQRYEEQETKLNVELSAIGAIKSSLSSFEDVVEKLADLENFNKRTARVTQPESGNLISVSATENATPSNFNVEVMQLAQGSRAVMADGLYTSPEDVVTASGGQLTLGAGADSFTVDLAAGATLEDLRNAINDADGNFGVSANIINDGTNTKLVLTSSTTGLGNDLTVTGDTAELDNITTTAFGGGAGGMAIAADDQATNAIIEIDGISVTNDTNTFKDAIQDITITALKESENNETAKLTVDVDKASVSTTIDEFINSFNNVIGTIEYHMQAGAALNGDSAMRSLKSQMVNSLTKVVSGAGNFETIFDVGIGLNDDGRLEKSSLVRSTSDALTEGYDDVGALFAGETGIATIFTGLLDNYLESDGAIKFRQDSLNQEIDKIENDRANHEYRMEQLEVSLRQQYSALDVLIANMKSSGDYLAAQLSSLPGFTKPKS